MTRVLLLDENQGNTCSCIYTVCHCRCDSCVVTRLLDENQGKVLSQTVANLLGQQLATENFPVSE